MIDDILRLPDKWEALANELNPNDRHAVRARMCAAELRAALPPIKAILEALGGELELRYYRKEILAELKERT